MAERAEEGDKKIAVIADIAVIARNRKGDLTAETRRRGEDCGKSKIIADERG